MRYARPVVAFELRRVASGHWFATWSDARIRLVALGSADAPHPAHRAALTDLVERWSDVHTAIESFVRALPAADPVRLEAGPGKDWSFAAGDCGFQGQLFWGSIALLDADPERATVTFHTGLPDGYATHEVVLLNGVPLKPRASQVPVERERGAHRVLDRLKLCGRRCERGRATVEGRSAMDAREM